MSRPLRSIGGGLSSRQLMFGFSLIPLRLSRFCYQFSDEIVLEFFPESFLFTSHIHAHICSWEPLHLGILADIMHAARARPSGWPVGPMGRPPTCFYPDGSPDFYAVPCASEGESHCCRNSSGICLSNGHCMDYLQPFAIWRGSCTDETWGSSSCPKVCAGM